MTTAVCVYCASADGIAPQHIDLAREVGEGIAARGWELVVAGASEAALGALGNGVRRAVRIDEGRYMLDLPLDPPPERLLAELSAAGASLVSLNPIRDTLEDFFVRHVGVSDTRQLVTSRHDR